jgi:hypothetical protein
LNLGHLTGYFFLDFLLVILIGRRHGKFDLSYLKLVCYMYNLHLFLGNKVIGQSEMT